VIYLAKKKRSHADKAKETKTASEEVCTTGMFSRFSPQFLHGAVGVLALLVIISGYLLGFQFGKLSMMDTSTVVEPTTATAPAPTQAAPTTPPPPEVPKTATPEVELFIMSYCPYGLQMQKAFVQAEELLNDNANMEVKWVSYLMHGEKELVDNTRQYCIQKEQPETWIAYEKCFVETTNHEQCAAKAGVDTAQVDACYAAADKEYGIQAAWDDKASWLSGRYAKYPVHAEENTAYGVRGSPTLVINGEVVQVARSAEAVKQAICNAFTNPPAACDQELNTNQEQPGAGPIGAGTAAGAAPSAGCGA
jgi:hypothetical protein